MKVALAFNLRKGEPPGEGAPPDAHAEFDTRDTVSAVAAALVAGGHVVELMEGAESALDEIRLKRPEIVFNMSEGLRGESRESHVPALLEMLGVPYTGSGVLTLAVALDKPAAKKLFSYHGVPTPAFTVIEPGTAGAAALCRHLGFPLFIKPAHEGSSMGISPGSLVRSPEALDSRVGEIHGLYRQPALVEEFVDGREFTVSILGNDAPKTLPIMEITFDHCPPEHGNVYSYQYKKEWDDDRYYACPAPVGEDLAEALRSTAVSAYRALGCRDVGRVDIRMGPDGVPQVLEVNPLPGLAPGFSDLPRSAAAAGMSFEALVNQILGHALERYGMQLPPRARRPYAGARLELP